MYASTQSFMSNAFVTNSTVLMQDYVWAPYGYSDVSGAFTQIDMTTTGTIGPDWFFRVTSSGSTAYACPAAPVDADYAITFTTISDGVGFPPAIPDAGNSMFMIGRADVSNNGYKAAITSNGSHYFLEFQVMPSGSITSIDLGDGATFYSFNVYLSMVGTSIRVAIMGQNAVDFQSYWLHSDGSWSTTGLLSVSFPSALDSAIWAVSITDATYTAPGQIIVGGTTA
jgi:hypothetical protein